MKRITSEELYPMTVSPSNFSKGDVVKKIYSDNITTPYVGLVTSIIPSTNKVEVKWPSGTGLEEPWDLIKVNPAIDPPVVKPDMDNFYQKQKSQQHNQSYASGLSHYSVLQDFVLENMMPLILKASELYNEGLSKKEAFLELKTASDHKETIKSALDKVYGDNISLERSDVITVNGEAKEANVSIVGDSEAGYKVSYRLGSNTELKEFDSYKTAFELFCNYETILASLDNKLDYEEIVSKVAKAKHEDENCEEDQEPTKVGTVNSHVQTIKLADLDIILDKIHKSLQEE